MNPTTCNSGTIRKSELFISSFKPWIAGTVVDPDTDEIVAGARVVVTHAADGSVASIETDEFGDFWLKNLKQGSTYRVEIAKTGYASFSCTVTADGDQDLGTVEFKAAK